MCLAKKIKKSRLANKTSGASKTKSLKSHKSRALMTRKTIFTTPNRFAKGLQPAKKGLTMNRVNETVIKSA